ncbi:MAG: pyridoxamine 5'-phosphate oxidase family protein [Pirellulales bacterium]
MSKPQPVPVSPEQAIELAKQIVATWRFPMLATMDGNFPRVRPVSPVLTEGFVVYVANLRLYHKTEEIAANPAVELCMNEEHHQVRISATAEIVGDQEILARIWESNPLLRSYLKTPDNPQLIVYRMVPNRVRFMQEWALQYVEIPLDS